GEEVEDQINGTAANWPSHVPLKPANPHAGGLRPRLRHTEEVGRKIDARGVVAPPRQLDGMPALPARHIQDAQRRSQLEQGLELIDLDGRALAQRLVIEREVARSEPGPPPI